MLRVLSWNISGHNVSQEASPGISLMEKHELLAAEVVRHDPDVVTLQEVALDEWGHQHPAEVLRLEALLGAAGYSRLVEAESHCGFTCVYLHSRLQQRAASSRAFSVGPAAAVELDLPLAGPAASAVMAAAEPWHEQQRRRAAAQEAQEAEALVHRHRARPLKLCFGHGPPSPLPFPSLSPDQPSSGLDTAAGRQPETDPSVQAPDTQPAPATRLVVAGVHLEPFDDCGPSRRRQLDALLGKACERRASHLVIVGDTNMTEEETQGVLDLGLQDAHLTTGRQETVAHTWDTHTNRYYGDHTRAYTARYDRLFCSGNIAVRALCLVGNQPLADSGYLSDHFGILCTVSLGG